MGKGDPTNVFVDGSEVSARTWLIINDAWDAVPGLSDHGRPLLAQGSWHHGSLSGSTHDGGGAADVRVVNVPARYLEAFVVELRRRNCCAWYRDEAHGGFTGHHIHLIVRDEPGLSSGARQQVRDYDAGLDGLSAGGPDYHGRPAQYPIEHYQEDTVTPEEIKAVADAVWQRVLKRPWDGKQATAEAMLGSAHFYAVQAGYDGVTPATATTSAGKPTIANQVLHGAPGGSLSDADVDRVANRVADILSARLSK